MPICVADASALLAYLRNEAGSVEVANILGDTSMRVFVHARNACEVYYDLLRRGGSTLAARAITGLRADGVEVRQDMDDAFWMDVGRLKVRPGGLSVADCVGIALAGLQHRRRAPDASRVYMTMERPSTQGLPFMRSSIRPAPH